MNRLIIFKNIRYKIKFYFHGQSDVSSSIVVSFYYRDWVVGVVVEVFNSSSMVVVCNSSSSMVYDYDYEYY